MTAPMSPRVKRALDAATWYVTGDGPEPQAPACITPRRTDAATDLRGCLNEALGVFDARDLLGDEGFLRADVQLVTGGDLFDDPDGVVAASVHRQLDATCLLAWLAAYPADQVVLLVGTGDLAQLATPTSGDVDRTKQLRDLLTRLRMQLAVAAARDGREVLLIHARVTRRAVEELRTPAVAGLAVDAERMQLLFDDRVDRVRNTWARGEPTPLSLESARFARANDPEWASLREGMIELDPGSVRQFSRLN